MSNRTLVMGDIHGAAKALTQVLERCEFDPGHDRLIFVGDVCDGWSETRECMDILMGIPNLVHLMGNHDWWTYQWMLNGVRQHIWVTQGGQATLDSFKNVTLDPYREFLRQAAYYYIDEEVNKLYIHAGLEYATHPLGVVSDETFLWDREMWYGVQADKQPVGDWDQIYIGNTSTTAFGFDVPMHPGNVWNMDTGDGWSGKLSVMDVDTDELWQSDKVSTLYPE